MKARYWGPFRQEWYSICSTHWNPKPGCPRCECGQWVNVHGQKVGHAFYKRWPKLWRLWANRPFCNGRRRFLEETFPRLRGMGLREWLKGLWR